MAQQQKTSTLDTVMDLSASAGLSALITYATDAAKASGYLTHMVGACIGLAAMGVIRKRSGNLITALMALAIGIGMPFVWTLPPVDAQAPMDAQAPASAQARVDAEPAGITGPTSLVLATGESTSFTLRVTNAEGNDLPNTPLSAEIYPKDLGTYENGRFLAGSTPQKGTVLVKAGPVKHLIEVTVTAAAAVSSPPPEPPKTDPKPADPKPVEPPPAPIATSISAPEMLTVLAGSWEQAPVVIKDQFGQVMTGIPIDATVTPTGLGTWSADLFEAGSVLGEGTLTLRAGSAVATVKLSVTYGAAHTLDVPSAITVRAGSVIEVPARLLDAKGNQIDGAEVVLSDPHDMGFWEYPYYTAGTRAGKTELYLRSGDVHAKIAVTIEPGDLAAVMIAADDQLLLPGTSTEISFMPTDEYGNPVTGASFDAVLNPPSLGTIEFKGDGSSATFTAGSTPQRGTLTLTARQGNRSAVVTLDLEVF